MGRPVDFERVKAAEGRIRKILKDHPEVAERTAAFFADEPSTEEIKGLMTDEKYEEPIQVRLPKNVLARVDAFAERLKKDPELEIVGRITRSSVLRLAILRGLEVLEKDRPATEDTGS